MERLWGIGELSAESKNVAEGGGIPISKTNENRTVPVQRGSVFKKAENRQGRQQARPRHLPPADSEISPTLCNFRL